MNLRVLAVGTRMPGWVTRGFDEYAVRLPRESALSLVEIPLARRSGTRHGDAATAREGEQTLKRIKPADHVIALDVGGRAFSTESLARHFESWLRDGRDRAFLIGGPDGLASACLDRADLRWSLSPLTLPHGLARVVVAEALYRAWTVLRGHPYHRA